MAVDEQKEESGVNEKREMYLMLKKCVGHQFQVYNQATVNAKECLNEWDINI